MNVLLTTLPFDISPDSIPMALPVLLAQLEKSNIAAKGIDFNAELYNDILTKEFISNTLFKIKNDYKHIDNKIEYAIKSNNIQELSYLKKIKNIYSVVLNMDIDLNNIETIKNSFLNKDFNLTSRMPKDVLQILGIAFSPYPYHAPWKSFSYDYNYEKIKDFSTSEKNNIFYNYLKKYYKKFNFDKYDLVGISLPLENSLYYAFTLGRFIKESTKNTKVILGGCLLSRIWDDIVKFPEIFDIFCDGLLVGDGDSSIIKYTQYIKREIDAKEVPSLIYRNSKNEIIQNPPISIDINDIEPLSLKSIDLKKYPKQILLNFQFSRGCYWGKCTFCTFSYPYRTKYSILNLNNAVDMIENFVKQYGIRNFYIIDETLPCAYIKHFAEEIIRRKLEIKYDCRLRLEKYYTKEVLTLLAQSGLRSVFWGYESESERILELMNKGIDIKRRKQILKTAAELNIVNKLGIIIGFPTETKEEIMSTIDFIKENHHKLFDKYELSIFALEKNSRIYKSPEKYNITNIKQRNNLGIIYDYVDSNLQEEEKKELIEYCYSLTKK